MHPSKKYFLVAEKSIKDPKIFVFKWPEYSIYRTLRGGAQTQYSCASFSAKGDQLATVAGFPDYTLTVWEWENELILQRAKAFSQVLKKIIQKKKKTNF